MKYSLLPLFLLILFFSSCSKKKDTDYREKYIGDYSFTTIREIHHDTTPTTFDTIRNYPGYISLNNKNTYELIIQFLPDSLPYYLWIVEINEDGSILSDPTALGGSLSGNFESNDKVHFYVHVGYYIYTGIGSKR